LFGIIYNVALALQSGFSLPELERHWLVYAPPAVGRSVLFNSTSPTVYKPRRSDTGPHVLPVPGVYRQGGAGGLSLAVVERKEEAEALSTAASIGGSRRSESLRQRRQESGSWRSASRFRPNSGVDAGRTRTSARAFEAGGPLLLEVPPWPVLPLTPPEALDLHRWPSAVSCERLRLSSPEPFQRPCV